MTPNEQTAFAAHKAKLLRLAFMAAGFMTVCPARRADGALRWQVTTHPTRNPPLALGLVGRW